MKKQSRIYSLLAISALCALVVIFTWSARGSSQSAQKDDKPEVEVITITPDGFSPSAIKRTKGTFLFVVDDHSGLPETKLSFDRLVGNSQKEKVQDRDVQRGQPLWAEPQKLQPGEYLLTEATHPQWRCLITISAK